MFGEVRWERGLHQRAGLSALAAAENRVVVHERHTRLVCLDRRDGSPLWDVPAGTWLRGLAIEGRRCLVLPQTPERLLCLDISTGERLWEFPAPGFAGHLTVAGDTVLLGGWRGYTPLMAVGLRDGRPRWRASRRTATVSPLAWEGGVLLGDGAHMWSIDPRDGEETARWRLPEPLTEADHRPVFTAAGPGRFLARCGSRSLVRLEPSSGRAEPLLRHGALLRPEAARYRGGLVWLRRRYCGYLAVDPATGAERVRVGERRVLAPGVVRTGEGFAVADREGMLLRVDADGQVRERSPQAGRIDALCDLGNGEAIAMTRGSVRLLALG